MNEETQLSLTHLMRPALEKPGENEATPLLLLLHGRGADETDLMGLEPALDPRFVVVSPRAPYRFMGGWAWYDRAEAGRPDPETFQPGLDILRTFIESLPTAYGVDPRRTYIFGFSQGAIVGSALTMSAPDLVAGLVMHSGYLPIALKGNAEISAALDPGALAGKPIFIAHGEYDEVIPVAWGRATYDYLAGAHANVLYREYPIGHAVSEESLYDTADWLTGQISGT
jgi:phospholipase/carboxylesterase